jgi:hypothetical protein
MMIFAYLDAGSGSLLLQAILGGLAGVAVAFKAWKARMTGKKMVQEAIAETEGPTGENVVTTDV